MTSSPFISVYIKCVLGCLQKCSTKQNESGTQFQLVSFIKIEGVFELISTEKEGGGVPCKSTMACFRSEIVKLNFIFGKVLIPACCSCWHHLQHYFSNNSPCLHSSVKVITTGQHQIKIAQQAFDRKIHIGIYVQILWASNFTLNVILWLCNPSCELPPEKCQGSAVCISAIHGLSAHPRFLLLGKSRRNICRKTGK